MISLMKKFIKDHWLGTTLIFLGTELTIWMMAAIFPLFNTKDMQKLFEAYPKELLAFFGGNELLITTYEGFMNAEMFSLMLIILVGGFLITLATSETSKEIDKKTFESLLTLPISRFKVIFVKWFNISLLTAFLSFFTVISMSWFASIYDISHSAKSFYMASIVTFLLFWAIATFTLALSVVFDDRGKPIFISIFILSAGYIINSVGNMVDKMKDYRVISIFYYYDVVKALADKEIALKSLLFFGIIIVVSTLFTFYWFNQRDFSN